MGVGGGGGWGWVDMWELQEHRELYRARPGRPLRLRALPPLPCRTPALWCRTGSPLQMGRRSKSTHASGATWPGDGSVQPAQSSTTEPLRRYSVNLIQRLGLDVVASWARRQRCFHHHPGKSSGSQMPFFARSSFIACDCPPALSVRGAAGRPRRPGVLKRPSFPLERAVARVCRVATDVFLRDLNLDVPLCDGPQIEVIANGLPAFGPRSPLMSRWYLLCNGTELAGPAMTSSLAKPSAKLRRGSGGQPTRSSPLPAGAGLPCLAWSWAGGGRQRLRISSPAWRVEKPLPAQPASARLRPGRSHAAGANCSRSPPKAHLARACSSSPAGGLAATHATCRLLAADVCWSQ